MSYKSQVEGLPKAESLPISFLVQRRVDMYKTWARMLLLSILALQVSGCALVVLGAAGAAGGVGTAMYVKGKLQEEFDAPLPRVHRATLVALRDLELPTLEEKRDKVTAKIRSQFADGKKVSIDIQATTESSSKITIRVGFGDKSRSQKILDAIYRHV